jgi:hypothetical protein
MSGVAAVIAARRQAIASRLGWGKALLFAALTLAGGIHLLLTSDHFAESPLMGIGFLGSAIAEFGLAATLLVSPRRVVYVAIIVVTSTLIGLYAYNVMVGLPFGGASTDGHVPIVEGEHGHDAQLPEHHSEPDGAGHAAEGHHSHGLTLGAGEAIDTLGAATKLSEFAAIGLAVMLIVRSSRPDSRIRR